MKKKIFYLLFSLLIFIPLIILLIPKEEETELSKLEKKDMLAYTIDGASASSMPTKGSGYVVNSITCKNGSELVWDNDNWKVEIVKIEDFDSCIIDFTKDLTKSSPRVTLTSIDSLTNKVDSTSKTVTNNGTVTFYLKDGYIVKSISNCNATLNDDKIIINSTSSNQTCNTTIGKNSYAFVDAILRDNPTISERYAFSSGNTLNTVKTIYKTNRTEDGSDVYYYSGNISNNWVKFGKGTKATCTYEGINIQYFDGSNFSTSLTEEQCHISNVCILEDYYFVQDTMDESTCTGYGGTYTNSLAIYNDSVETDYYWRIIRTNEDESVRIIYTGTTPDSQDGYIGDSVYNSTSDLVLNAGYMYGTSGSLSNNRLNTNSSTVKKYLDEWYKNNLLNNYDKYISKSAIYCNDRSIGSGSYSTSTSSSFYYGTYTRLNTNSSPSYKCGANANNGLFESTQALADKFSASTSGGGNGKLTYPIALATADELAFSGIPTNRNMPSGHVWIAENSKNQYISNEQTYIATMTPASNNDLYVLDLASSFEAFVIGENTNATATRPVISIDKCAYVTGTGTPEDPYVIDESTC